MPTIFTRIVKGEIPCQKIAEDENYLAFLEIKPVNPGHTLVIPKREVDYFFDLEDSELGGLMIFSKKVAKAIKAAVPCKRIGAMVAGLEVRHAHVHLIPILESGTELTFTRAKETSAEELSSLAQKIRAHL